MITIWREAVAALGYAAQARLVVPLAMLTLLWCWEWRRPFFGIYRRKARHDARNLTIAAMNAAALAFTLGLLTIVVAELTDRHHWGLLQQIEIGDISRMILALFLLDGWMYLWHRANHRIPFLWRFHRMHHSDPEMDVTTAVRFHLGEQALGAVLRLGLIPLLGFTVWHIVIYESLLQMVIQFHHADVSIGRYDRWLRLLIVTPNMHKMHHSRLRSETDSNYSSVFSIWDRLARTFTMRADVRTLQFGLDDLDGDAWQTVGGMLKTPLQPMQRTSPADQVSKTEERKKAHELKL